MLTMGWSFAKEPYKRDYIVQKRRTILRSLLIVATPTRWLEIMTERQGEERVERESGERE